MIFKSSPKVRSKAKILLVTFILACMALTWQVYRLSAGPKGEKECPPLIPLIDDSHTATVDLGTYGAKLTWEQRGGIINDASCLDATPVFGIIDVRSENDISNALAFAREKNLKVSIAGVRHSMGGHAFAKGAVVLDMRHFNTISLDANTKVLSAQSGAIWADIQSFLHPRFAVKSMQSTDLFTIGGSMSVNAHGMDHQAGSVGRTVRSFRFMFTDGHIETISREGSPRLFNLIIGGYGMFGVILDVKLDVVDNVVYKSDRKIITYTDFPEVFKTEIEANKDIGLFYGHLSTARSSLLKDMILYTYTEVKDADPESVPVLTDYSMTSLRRFLVNFSKMGRWPMEIKWFGERYIEPRIETCDVHTRNKALGDGERCLVSRNEPMHDSVSYLRNSLKNDTDILQEYYIPRDNFVAFIDDLREIVLRDDANLLNASVRVIHKEDNYLTYASGERFAVVLYLNQKTNDAANKKMEKLTKDIIDVALKNKGTFFLPYQLYYTPEQLKAAYPMIKSFFDAKKVYDPEGLLQSTFYEKYHLKV